MRLLECPSPSFLLAPWLPPLLQEEAEALVELQRQLQEAQEATETLRVQVSARSRGWEVGGTGRGMTEARPGKCLLPQ